MQGTGFNRRRIILLLVSIVLTGLLIFIDLFTKVFFKNKLSDVFSIDVIKDFFYFVYTFNEGSAYGMLQNMSWAQTFFKILTPIALVLFLILLYYSIKNEYKFFSVAIAFVIGGTVGNFVDRLAFNGVRDFICLEINGNRIFGIFNLADVFLTVGVIMFIIHFLFLDKGALLKKKNEK